MAGLEFYEPFHKLGYKVIYFPQIIKNESLLTQEEFQELLKITETEEYEGDLLDFTQSYALKTYLKTTIAPFNILSLGEQRIIDLNNYINALEESDEKEELCQELCDYIVGITQGHAIGGYPNLAQSDPRGENDDRKILLLQIDSSGEIMIGDCGSIQFFISEKDLKNRDFTNVLYDWACG